MAIKADYMHPAELLVLQTLNIEPTGIARKTGVMFDVRFDYEKRYVLDQNIGGKEIKVVEYASGEVTHLPAFTMPPVGTVTKCKASAWFPLLIVHLGFSAGYLRAPHGDWSFIRDGGDDEIWAAFKWFTDTHMNTPERAARFAQP